MTNSSFRFASASFILAILTAVPALAVVVPAKNARITEVTVFRDRAEITREARVQLPAGASTVQFETIPFGVEPDSLRVRAAGVAAAPAQPRPCRRGSP